MPPKRALRWQLQRVSQRARRESNGFTVPHAQFWCDTEDGIRLAGTLVSTGRSATAVVLVHGFMGYRQKRPWRFLAEELAHRFDVLTFDLRGHGQSTGGCSGGELEYRDVAAVVAYARARGYERVVTVGGSLGGIAVITHAAMVGDVDACVAISTPSQWGASDSKAVRRAMWLFVSPLGRALARGIMGTTIGMEWGNPPPPAEAVAKIAPTPLLVIHGEDDHFFSPRDAQELFERAGEPKRLILLPRFGHAEDGFSAAFAARLRDEIDGLLALGRPPDDAADAAAMLPPRDGDR